MLFLHEFSEGGAKIAMSRRRHGAESDALNMRVRPAQLCEQEDREGKQMTRQRGCDCDALAQKK